MASKATALQQLLLFHSLSLAAKSSESPKRNPRTTSTWTESLASRAQPERGTTHTSADACDAATQRGPSATVAFLSMERAMCCSEPLR